VAAGEKALILQDIQIEGKKRMKVADFLRGFSVEKGIVLK